MSIRLTVRMAAPSIAISLVLLALGIVGGWYVQHLQRSTAEMVKADTSTIRAAEQLVFGLTEIHSELTEYLLTDEQRRLDAVPAKCAKAEQSLVDAEKLADDANEKALTKTIRDGYDGFRREYGRVEKIADKNQRRLAVRELIDESLDRQILDPAKQLLSMEEDLVQKSGDSNRELARWVAFFLFLVGVCGAVAGLVAGFGIARSVSRSIVELYLQIRAASGRLEEVIGPVDVARGTRLRVANIENLDAVLKRMADHVGAVVDRLQQSQTKMLRTERMAALGQLAAGLAHELRNPLTAMKMLIAGAAESGDPAQLTSRDLAVLTTEIARLERSIQAFLDFARPPKLERRRRDVREVVRQTLDLVAARGKQQGIRLQSELPDRPVIVEADHEQLRQLLLNLVLNAMDAQPQGGAVLISVTEGEENGDITHLPGRPEGGFAQMSDVPVVSPEWIELTVADQGPGIAEGMAERIFEPYVSTKETGLGLGLAICRRIVEDHGGQIDVENPPDGGADFRVRLPVKGTQVLS